MGNIVSKCFKLVFNKEYRFKILAAYGFYNKTPDKEYLERKYRLKFQKEIDWENPSGFNEKMQWLKLNDRKDIYTYMVDKYEVKAYISDLIGDEYVIPTYGVWDRFDDIDFDSLPNEFVLKCTHDSSGPIIVKDKALLDMKWARKKIAKCLKRNYYYHCREWPYKNVKPRIMAEKLMKEPLYDSLNVYKIFNFNGEPKVIQTIQDDKTPKETIDYFDTQWNLLDLRQNYPNSLTPLKRPEALDLMLELSKKMSKDTPPFIRTDFYCIDGQVYFSEFTFYSDAGFAKFVPEEYDQIFGEWIDIRAINKK